ncbi:MAG: hypothetical protein UH241_02970 [Acutalibacteraceae bacterium]|nr:hypothetical protein [Acutalibacteraceae bacterium]
MSKVKIITAIVFFIISFALLLTGIIIHIATAKNIPSDDFSSISTTFMVSGCGAMVISIALSLIHLNTKDKGAKK